MKPVGERDVGHPRRLRRQRPRRFRQLEHPEPITQRAPESLVAKSVVGATTILLLVDAASTNAELQEAFEEFERFLDVVWGSQDELRARSAGFPVFLVLTQCDRLASPRRYGCDVGTRVKASLGRSLESLSTRS